MTDHPALYEILAKAYELGRNNASIDLIGAEISPAAYPVITPLIEEAVKYVNDCIESEARYAFERAEGFIESNRRELEFYKHRAAIFENQLMDIASKQGPTPILIDADNCLLRPSSPFRSVELLDGSIVE